jgi:hypothetical protein
MLSTQDALPYATCPALIETTHRIM